MKSFTEVLIAFIKEKGITTEAEAQQYWESLIPHCVEFFDALYLIQEKPISPITNKRRIKILFTGLENTGKTSFMLMLNRKFSELPSLLPTGNPQQEPINFLGTTIVKWDIPGQKKARETVLMKSEMYLFETDVLYYFIDVRNPRIEESKDFLHKIMENIHHYGSTVPIVFIITKVDEDISQKKEIRDIIDNIKDAFLEIVKEHPYKFFETSIFSFYSILNAFSFGLRQLSPNREMLEHLMMEFMNHNGILTSLLVNKEGLVLAGAEIEDIDNRILLSRNQIFELTASNFTAISQQFKKYTPTSSDTTIYNFSDEDIVVLKQFLERDFVFYFILYIKSRAALENIEKNFPRLVEQIQNLLELYIS